MSKKLKAIESNIQPNHKEAEIWVTPTNEDGSKEVKYWNKKKHEWDGCNGGEKLIYMYGDLSSYDALAGWFAIYYDTSTLRGWMTVYDANNKVYSEQEIQGTLKEVPFFNGSKIIIPVFDVAIESVQQQEDGSYMSVTKLHDTSFHLAHSIPCSNIVDICRYRSSGDNIHDYEASEYIADRYYSDYILTGQVSTSGSVTINTPNETIVDVVYDYIGISESEIILLAVGVTNSGLQPKFDE